MQQCDWRLVQNKQVKEKQAGKTFPKYLQRIQFMPH